MRVDLQTDVKPTSHSGGGGRKFILAAFVLSAFAAALALLSGFVSKAESTTYQWSRGDAPFSASQAQILDSTASSTPVLLSAHVPDRIEVEWTCNIGGGPADLVAPYDIVGTFNGAGRDGLYIHTDEAGTFQLVVQGRILAEVKVPARPDHERCSYTVIVQRDGSWVIRSGAETLGRGFTEPPIVSSVSTQLVDRDPVDGEFIVVGISTVPHGPSASGLRTSLRMLAAGFVAGSVLLLLAAARKSKPRLGAGSSSRRKPKFHLRSWQSWLDHLLVLLVLLVWWVVGPVLFDDGWVMASVANLSSDGVIANYYDSFNAAFPLGSLHELIIAGFASLSQALLWLRIPALLAGLATWAITRSVVDRGARSFEATAGLTVHLATASVFLLSWISWNNTLRPEPLTALLVAIALWASTKFVHDQDPRLLLVGSIAVALGLSMGASGIVILAVPIVSVLTVLDWVKQQKATGLLWLCCAAFAGSAVLLLALLSVGDAGFWSASRQMFSSELDHSFGWRDELNRYTRLFQDAASSSVRQISALLPFIAPIMYLFRRQRRWNPLADSPVLGLLVAVLLLAFTPSKWFWHFGALTALAAAAVGIESHRWSNERIQAERGRGPELLILAGVAFATAMAWRSGLNGWNDLALIELDSYGTGAGLSGSARSDPWLWLAGGVGATALGILITRRLKFGRRGSTDDSFRKALLHSSTWAVPVAAFLTVVVAVFGFAIDGLVLSPGWSLARQNLDELVSSNCGLADEILIPSEDGSTPNRSLRAVMEERGGSVLAAPQIRMYFPCIRQPTIENGKAETPSLIVSSRGWPTGLPRSPHHYLSDVAVLHPVPSVWAATGGRLPFDIVLVEESP